MKNYTITVNGNIYEVTVEEKSAGSAPISVPAAVPKAAPIAPEAVTKAVPNQTPLKKAESAAGLIKITSGAAGKIFKIETTVGQAVKSGDTVVVIEAMKMEIPVVAPEDGIVTSIDVAVGDAIDAGVTLATLN